MSGAIEDDRNMFQKKWDAFRGFMYDPRNHTVMGRTGKSWAKILIFYMFYYGFLACLFAISITIVLSTLDEYTPKYQTRLQTPGVSIQPKTPSDVDQTSDIFFSLKDSGSYEPLTTILDKFLDRYELSNQTNDELYRNCAPDDPPLTNQQYNDDQIERSCRFDRKQLGPCVASPYGYNDGNPCILVKVNRIIDWVPVGFTDLSKAVGNDESDAPPLSEVLAANGNAYKPYLMYVSCYGGSDEDNMKLTGGDMKSVKYYPQQNGLPFAYYPYLGKKRQPGYLSPVVAVQFTNVSKDEEIKVNCKAYARNIRDSRDREEGYFSFNMKISN